MLFHNYLSILKFNEDIVMTCKKVVVAIVDNEVVGKNCSLLYGGEEWIVAIIHIILTIQRGWVLGCNKNRVAFTIIPALIVDISVVEENKQKEIWNHGRTLQSSRGGAEMAEDLGR